MVNNKIVKGVIACTIAGVAFGAQWPVAGSALKLIDPYYFTLLRYGIVAIILAIILLISEGKKGFKVEKRQLLPIFFMGTLAFCVFNFFVFAGQQMAGTSGTILASLLMTLVPMISVLVLWVITKERPRSYTLILAVISLVGVLLVITKGSLQVIRQDSHMLPPMLLMIISVLAWVFYTIGEAQFAAWSPLKYTTISCLLGNIASIIVIIIMTGVGMVKVPTLQTIVDIKFQLGYMSLIAGVLGVLMWNIGNTLLTPQNGSLFMNLAPIVTLIVEVAQGYHLSGVELTGAIITVFAIIMNNVLNRVVQAHEWSPQKDTKI